MDFYLYLARELRKLWNIRLTVIPILIGVLGTVFKGLEKEIGRVGNRRSNRDHPDHSIFFKSARVPRRVLETEETVLIRRKTNAGVKTSQVK